MIDVPQILLGLEYRICSIKLHDLHTAAAVYYLYQGEWLQLGMIYVNRRFLSPSTPFPFLPFLRHTLHRHFPSVRTVFF